MIKGRKSNTLHASLMFGAALAFGAAITAEATYAIAQTVTATGPFTDAQAIAGETLFNRRCVTCHGDAGEAATMTGDSFLNIWKNHTTKDLFDRIKTTMPTSNPGDLSDAEVSALVAYLLWLNGTSAGAADFTPTTTVPINALVPAPAP